MALLSTDQHRFFGMDTSTWRALAPRLLASPALRWVQPAVRVQLRHADGRSSVWDVAHGRATPAPKDADAAIAAVELPAARVLERSLQLPPLAPADLAQAVQLDVAGASPFPADQTVHGFTARPGGTSAQRVDVAITSRQEVDEALRQAGVEPSATPEVWVLPSTPAADGVLRPLVLRGQGERQRERLARQGLLARLGLLLLALVLLGMLALTPTLMLRQRSSQAQESFEGLQRQAAPQLAQREAVMQRLERIQAVDKLLTQQLALPPVLDMLTRALPDGAWLTALRVEGGKLVLNGQADDAAALVQRLAAEAGVHDVRLSSPATRGFGAAKESFIIEMQLDARRYGLARPAAGAAS